MYTGAEYMSTREETKKTRGMFPACGTDAHCFICNLIFTNPLNSNYPCFPKEKNQGNKRVSEEMGFEV